MNVCGLHSPTRAVWWPGRRNAGCLGSGCETLGHVTDMILCAACQADRTDTGEGEPCPACGSTDVTRQVFLHDAASVSDAIAEVEIRPDQRPRWWERWERLLRARGRLREAYVTADHEQLRRVVDEFFLDCWSLKDWLVNDDQITPRVTRREIEGHVDASRPLRVCQGYANTVKHKTLNSPDRLEARISSFRIRPEARHVLITYQSRIQTPTTRDALRLADQCVAAWQRFLDTRGLQPPAK